MKVGAKRAGKLENEVEHDEWFSAIGDGENLELLRLYHKVLIDIYTMTMKNFNIFYAGVSSLFGPSTHTNPTGC